MKILFLATDLFRNRGGIQTYTVDLCRALSLSEDVSVLSLNDSEVVLNEPFRLYGAGKVWSLRKVVFLMKVFLSAFLWKPDYIWCGHVHFACLCRFIQVLTGIPVIGVTYGIESWQMNPFQKTALAFSKRIITISCFTKERIVKQLPAYPSENVVVVPCSVNTEKFKPDSRPMYLMKKLNINASTAIILTVSRLSAAERYKGYDAVLDALPFVRSAVSDMRYIIVGTGDDEARIRRIIHEKGLDAVVNLVGNVSAEEIGDYYNLCDCFIMPSSGEGFGIVFLEALACGKPVIAGNSDASREALLGGKLGILVEPGNTKQITEALIGLLCHTQEAQLFDTNYLRKEVCVNFGFDVFSRRVMHFVKSLGL